MLRIPLPSFSSGLGFVPCHFWYRERGFFILVEFYKINRFTVSLCECISSQKAFISHTSEKFLRGEKKYDNSFVHSYVSWWLEQIESYFIKGVSVLLEKCNKTPKTSRKAFKFKSALENM